MTAPEELLPPELAVDEVPLTDADLARYFAEGPSDPEALEHPEDYTEDAVARSRTHAWRVEDHRAAEWAGRKLQLSLARIKPQQQLAVEWHAQIDAWLEQVTFNDRRTVGYMTERLEDYALRAREAGGEEFATITLPSVVLTTRTAKPTAVVADDELAAAYLEQLFHWAFGDAAEEDAELEERRQTMAASLADAMGEATPTDVVKRAPKVYVTPFRRLVHIGAVSTGWRVRVELECEHWSDGPCEGLNDPEVPAVGVEVKCGQCTWDPIDGPPARRTTDVTVYEVTEPAVFGPDGQLVPGADVDPGGVTPKVKAR